MSVSNFEFLIPQKKDSKKIFNLVKNTKVLDINSEYLYLLQTTHFRNTCCVVKEEDNIVGFISGYVHPQRNNVLFIWQVAVDEKVRGKSIAKKMMLDILKREENKNIKYINTTVSPSNKASIRAFEKLAQDLNTKIKGENFFEIEDFISSHEEEVLYEIGPFEIKEKK